ncbi:hypothetical protein [Phenylobacterium sp.]|uniref:hypothetical protein n=1 Tax=Phenylobacterium sp. TaxID=1871053 RepID=UPI0012098A9A|nr:hypothetical protein [Phenylobacterium sp.]TAL30514.1 MAG: hypothetical protein EPN98_17735 [Phenylobacterium sp.]
MNSGLTHTGAIARGLAYAPDAVTPRTWRSTAELLALSGKSASVASENSAQPEADPVSLFRASSFERIRAESAMIVGEALRSLAAQNQARAYVRPMAHLVDVRI